VLERTTWKRKYCEEKMMKKGKYWRKGTEKEEALERMTRKRENCEEKKMKKGKH
jgi:hypothetical protein